MIGKFPTKTLCCIFVLIPLLTSLGVIVINGIPDGFLDGDYALIGLAIDSASHFNLLTGLSSRTGFHHPGPLYFYLLWPLYHFTNFRSFSLDVTVIILNLLFIGGTLIVIQRHCHHVVIVSWFALLMVQYLRYLGSISMNPWTPCVTILGFWCGALCFVAVAFGKTNYLPIAVIIMSFVVQTHFGYAPAFGMTMILAVIFLCYPHLKTLFRGTSDKRDSILPILFVSLLILVILWMPPLIEQFSHDGGNITKMVKFFHEHKATRSWQEAYLLSTKIFSNYLLSWFNQVNPWQQFTIHAGLSQGIFWGQLCLLGGVYFIAKNPKYVFLRTLTVFVICWHIVFIISIQRIIGEVHDYLVIWMSGLGLFSWFLIGASLISLGMQTHICTFAKHIREFVVIVLLTGMGCITFHSTKAFHNDTLYALKHRNFLTATPDFHTIVETAVETLHTEQATSCMITLLDRDAWPAVAGLALEFLKTNVSLTLNPRFPANSYSNRYIPTMVPDGQLILATKLTAETLSSMQSLIPVKDTQTLRLFWRTLPEQLEGMYLFEFLSLFSLRNEGFSETGRNSLKESFRWSSDLRSSLSLPLTQGHDYILTLNMAIPQRVPKISVFVNNRYMTEFYFEKWEWRDFSVTIPQSMITQPTDLTLQYHYHEPPELPFKQGQNGNAVAFRMITFGPSSPNR